MKITQIAVLLSSFLLISACRETQPVAQNKVKEKQDRQLVTETSPAAIQVLIEDASAEVSLLALNAKRRNRSGKTGEKPANLSVRKTDIQEADDDFQNLPPADTFWLQNLKMSLRQ